MILVIAAGGTITLENPQNSLIALHPRHIWLVQLLVSFGIHVPWLYFSKCSAIHVRILEKQISVIIAKFFKVSFWMRKHLAMTWKRTWMWGTSGHIQDLDRGPLHASERPVEVKTTKRWVGKDGKQKWHGTKSLKQTQFLGVLYYIL